MAQISERYYSGRDVQRKLGITEPALRNLVNQKRLRKITPPGRSHGVYLREEVDTYAEKWFSFLTAQDPPKTSFRIAEPEDMDAVYELAKRAIGSNTMNAETRREWLKKNPETCYIVKHGEKLVAFFHLLPLKQETMNNFMEGKIRGWHIKGDDVEMFEPNISLECLAIIASEPDVDNTTRSHYVMLLVRGTMEEMRKLGERGIILSKIYATSETPTGIRTAIHAGMEIMENNIGKRIRFMTDVQNTKSFLVDSYKEGYENWKKRQAKQNRINRMSSDKNEG